MSGKIDCLTEFVARVNALCYKSLEHEQRVKFDHASFIQGRLSLGKEIMFLLSSNKEEREDWIKNFLAKNGV